MIKKINIEVKGDHRGSLIALESLKNVPFKIKRVYTIFDTKEKVSRGFHAHKNLKQFLICLRGSFTLILDDGYSREKIDLSSPTYGVLIEKLIWRELENFSKDCIILVLASEKYDESDYIRNYNEFKELTKT